MVTIYDVYNFIDEIAPFCTAEDFDNSGILLGNKDEECNGILVTLDMTDETILEAVKKGCNLVVTHHPIIFHPLKKILSDSVVYKAIQMGISVISAHTNLDKAKEGVGVSLANALDLVDVECMENGYVFLGELQSEVDPQSFAHIVKNLLEAQYLRFNTPNRIIKKVAVCGGSGGSFLDDVLTTDVDCFITGDIKHSLFLQAAHHNIMLMDAGHFDTEKAIVPVLAEIIAKNFLELPISISEGNISITKTI